LKIDFFFFSRFSLDQNKTSDFPIKDLSFIKVCHIGRSAITGKTKATFDGADTVDGDTKTQICNSLQKQYQSLSNDVNNGRLIKLKEPYMIQQTLSRKSLSIKLSMGWPSHHLVPKRSHPQVFFFFFFLYI
jgi:hypothetical protein